jgi:hypothetical protein
VGIGCERVRALEVDTAKIRKDSFDTPERLNVLRDHAWIDTPLSIVIQYTRHRQQTHE